MQEGRQCHEYRGIACLLRLKREKFTTGGVVEIKRRRKEE